MMLIPGLRHRPQAQLTESLDRLQRVLARHHAVVFVDLNLLINTLWVSITQHVGAVQELSESIRQVFPEARLVGHTVGGCTGKLPSRRRLR